MTAISGFFTDCGTPEKPLPHVSWICPLCGRWMDTDLAPEDAPPISLHCGHFKCDENALHTVVWLPILSQAAKPPSA